MEYFVILDVSSIIWDESDYHNNTDKYYELAVNIMNLFDVLEKEKPKILLRDELLEAMMCDFPFNKIPHSFLDFETRAFYFLAGIGSDIIQYTDALNPNISSIPDLIKLYYKETIKNEVGFLITKIHSSHDDKNVFITFSHLWNNDEELKTIEVGGTTIEHETIISDNGNDLKLFFQKNKPIFEHNPKHDRIKPGEFESSLSCYDGENLEEPQALLDSAYEYKGCFYNFKKNTWVVFRCHLDNKYHGYDEKDENKIPYEVRKHFRK